MKHIFFSLVLFFLSFLSGFSQQTAWQWVNPLPQGNLINAAFTISQDSLFGVCTYGTVIRSTNSGTTWQVEPSVAGTSDQLFASYFISSTTGWAVGESGRALKTTDGGTTWFTITVPTIKDLFGVSFVSPSTGWVTGGNGVIFGTTDGGFTWTLESSGTTNTLFSVFFKSSTLGWTVGSGGIILKTTNGGATWLSQPSGTTQSLYSIQFVSTSVGWISGSFGTILRTVTGGSSWTPQTSSVSFSLYGIHFPQQGGSNFTTGWAVGQYGTVLKTTNGGLSWFDQSGITYNDLFTVQFASLTTGWAMGDLGTILYTSDGGSTWITQSNGIKSTLNAVHFPTSSIGYSVGEEGSIIKTTNSGVSWTLQPSGLYQSLYAVYFANSLTGWAIGDSAVILKTTNGGFNWIEQHSHTDFSLYSIYFPSPLIGWTVGDFGTILATSNGGLSWVPETSHTSSTLLGVRFFNNNIGWAVGYGGTIIKTTNGGSTWFQQTSGTNKPLYAIDIVDTTHVHISGDFGLILYSTNSGNTWETQYTGTDASLYSLSFYSRSMGWAVGDDGIIVSTTNSGTSWQVQSSNTDHTLWGVQAVPTPTGGIVFATGIGGTILCSGLSPLPIRTWTGAFDSLWTTAGNWNPLGIPEKIDSVIIPNTTTQPVIKYNTQQISISSLKIASGAKLTISNGLGQLVVKDDISVDGTLEFDPLSATNITTGGNFFISSTGTFNSGKTTVIFDGQGTIRGTFYNLILRESANMRSIGPINILGNMIALSDLQLRDIDTISFYNPDPYALQGNGAINAGTIKRALKPGSIDPYRFESPETYLEFHPTGTIPDTIVITTFPNVLPPGLPDTLFVRRYFNITTKGGNNYLAFMSLHYDTTETRLSVDDLSLFRDSGGIQFNMGKADFLDSDIVAISLDSVKKFSTWYIGKSDYEPKHPLQFIDSIFVTDNGAHKDTLTYGSFPGATDSIDAILGEVPLGSTPPSGTFDARWLIPTGQETKVDIRDLLNADFAQHIYTLRLQPGPGGYPFTIRWNPSSLASGTFFLRDKSTHGGQFNISMKLQDVYTLTNSSISQIEVVHIAPLFYNFGNSWNMVSLPLTPTNDGRSIHVFPKAISKAYGYNGSSYFYEDTLKNGRGYWIKFPYPQRVPMDGLVKLIDTITVTSAGWKMIGSVTYPVSINDIQKIPSGVIRNTIYGYAGSYVLADSIRPAKGYWVKATGPGKIVLSSSGPNSVEKYAGTSQTQKNPLEEFNSITIGDRTGNSQTLYFGSSSSPSFSIDDYELPPTLPWVAFDARFSSGRLAELISDGSSKLPFVVHSDSYPLTLSWHLAQPSIKSIKLQDAVTGKSVGAAIGYDGVLRIENQAITQLILQVDAAIDVPKEFSLLQNYPNPFNPTTTIAFTLPTQANVTLKIFNILGQEVTTLADNVQYAAGSHILTLNADNLASGVYFYQLAAHGENHKEFRQVKKMLLVR